MTDTVLQIEELPTDATVTVDGVAVEGKWVDADRTSWVIRLLPGEHQVVIARPGVPPKGGRYLITRYGLFERYSAMLNLPTEAP